MEAELLRYFTQNIDRPISRKAIPLRSNNARARSVSADGVARTIGRVRRQYGARQSGSLEYDGPSTVRPTAVGNIHQNETRPVEDAESW